MVNVDKQKMPHHRGILLYQNRLGCGGVVVIGLVRSRCTTVTASRGKIVAGGAKFPLFTGEISDKTAIKALWVEKQVGDYYRDLFIHRLPGGVTEMYIALIADGFLMGIIGLHLADLRRGKVVKNGDKVLEHCASVTFAFTADHPRYDRLHKNMLMSITSEWFWDDVLGAENWYELNGAPKHVKTTMLTHHPEVKSARGIFKLDTREQQKDGTYKLTYSTATNRRSREATLKEWLTRFAEPDLWWGIAKSLSREICGR
jgi:hypothetical protein